MYIKNGKFTYSPSDISLFSKSQFASWMDHYSLINEDIKKYRDEDDESLKSLQDKGIKHEKDFFQKLLDENNNVCDLTEFKVDKYKATIDAMKKGYDVIYQGRLELEDGCFGGYPDFLMKVKGKSLLGDYHYEVWDTKLSKHVKPEYTIQLCSYQEMIKEIQGMYSVEFVILLGNQEEARLRTEDFFYYYLTQKNQFLEFHNNFDIDNRPDPGDPNEFGSWETYANQILVEEDHLLQIAGITRTQIKKINIQGIKTVQGLIDTKIERIPNLDSTIFNRLKKQAKLQKDSIGKEKPIYELIFDEDGKSALSMLPPKSKNDVFFDIEGYPFADGGLEYLWGNTYFNEKGEKCFKDFWAHDRKEEKQAFKEFVDWVYDKWEEDSFMHIYHYANYEIAACKKLMQRYGVGEAKIDSLLRNNVFVDLYKVVKRGLMIGESRYSIKNVEHLYRAKRETEVASGGDSIVVYEKWVENPDGKTWEDSEILKSIRDYNIDDCDSTQELFEWLSEIKRKNNIEYLGSDGERKEDPNKDITEENDELKKRLLKMSEAYLKNYSEDSIDESKTNIPELLRDCLDFHKRESSSVFWKKFERLDSDSETLFDDSDCLANCEIISKETVEGKKSTAYHYKYKFDINQEFKNSAQSYFLKNLRTIEGREVKVTVLGDERELKKGIIELKSKEDLPEYIDLIPDEYVNPGTIPVAIREIARDYADGKITKNVLLEILNRNSPKTSNENSKLPLSDNKEDLISEVIDIVKNLDCSYLTIQGPPGTGKTYTAKHIIAELLRDNKKIGITSNSHKAINNLLISTAKYCKDSNIKGSFFCTSDTDKEIKELEIKVITNPKIESNIEGACVVGSTAWGFSREELKDKFDYLFIDEAGQVSIANLIAMSRAAKNIVILGDQMQLSQPTKGSHPGDSGLSILNYLLGEMHTIPSDMGVFLGKTYRMNSSITEYVSSLFYEGKLKPDSSNDDNKIIISKSYKGIFDKEQGIIFIPVEHSGNTQSSDEEIEAIKKASKELIGREFMYKGKKKKISNDNIIYLAPYNQQVNKLIQNLEDNSKVGTVDKFQGQEAPIVFISMCSSDANESSRGIDFLFDSHRLNVAISRAEILVVIFANPNLVLSTASNIGHQRKINSFCRLVSCN